MEFGNIFKEYIKTYLNTQEVLKSVYHITDFVLTEMPQGYKYRRILAGCICFLVLKMYNVRAGDINKYVGKGMYIHMKRIYYDFDYYPAQVFAHSLIYFYDNVVRLEKKMGVPLWSFLLPVCEGKYLDKEIHKQLVDIYYDQGYLPETIDLEDIDASFGIGKVRIGGVLFSINEKKQNKVYANYGIFNMTPQRVTKTNTAIYLLSQIILTKAILLKNGDYNRKF